MDKLNEKINKIKDILEPSMNHMFIANELILSEKTMKDIKNAIKNDYDAPKKNIKGFIIRIKVDKNNKKPLIINCTQVTVTPKLFVDSLDDDVFQIFTYTQDELLKFGFKLIHIKKMMKAIKNNLVSFEKSSIPISELLKN
jgi:hypothetical protein